jgi:transketolase
MQIKNLAPSLKIDLNLKSIRDGAGFAITEAGSRYDNLYVLTADLRESVRVEEFSKKYPKKFIECGVAEQNMAGIAAGLSLCGNKTFITSFAVFSPGRNWDQIRVSICYSDLDVKILGGHAGLLTGEDGATHQALEDIAITRVLPNMTVINPCDFNQAIKAVEFSLSHKGPVYIRAYREKTIQVTTEETEFNSYEPQIFKEGSDLTIISSGPIISEVLKTVEQLENKNNLSIELINIPFIKPLNVEKILKSLRKTKKGVVIEEHQIHGGVGSAILEKISENEMFPIKIIGVKDTFGESGNYKDLYEKYELSSPHQVKKILNFLDRIK